MKILSLSDTEVSYIYSPLVKKKFQNVDVVLGCGDLSYFYLEYISNALDAPLFFVRGNHDPVAEYNHGLMRTAPAGGVDLHRHFVIHQNNILVGIEGSHRYRPGRFQYSQFEMWLHVVHLIPKLIINRLTTGRYLDIFVTHAPPAGIHDREDLPHRGIQAFRWFIQVFQPAYHFHGHIHVYQPDIVIETELGNTRIVNTFGFRQTEFDGNNLGLSNRTVKK